MHGRTIVLVSHHVQLCAPGASYIVALDNGRVQFQGDSDAFQTSGVINGLVQSGQADDKNDKEEVTLVTVEDVIPDALESHSPTSSTDSETEPSSDTNSTAVATVTSDGNLGQKNTPRKLVEEEKRAVGRIGTEIWSTYIWACGGQWYWCAFLVIFIVAAMSPVAENGWLK